MKKVFWAVVAMVILATACTKDDAVSGGNDSLVSFTIDSPELVTRYGEGVSTNRLVYAFYDEAGNHLQELDGSVENYKTKTTIKVYLVEGRKYQAIFWADNTAAGYAVDFATKTMTINDTTLDGNSEEYDAFYNYTLNIDPADKTHTIELRRPFAQINIATKDTAAAKAAGVEVKATKVEVDAYKTLTFGTEVDSTTGEVVPVAKVSNEETFTYDWAPKAEGKAMTDYDMLSMNYVLVNARELVDVTLRMSEAYTDGQIDAATDLVRNYTTVPVQRNYRTYIVGNLLTTSNDFNIETKPGFEDDDKFGVIDGQTFIRVSSVEEFNAAFADSNYDLIILDADIELSESKTRAADATLTVSKDKVLTIDLNGKKLSATSTQTGKNYNMFDVRGTLTVKNGTMEYEHKGDNMAWNNFAEIFYVGFDGTLNLEGVTAKNLGGSDMAYVIDMVNATNITVNVDNSTLESTYIPIRVFNNSKTGVNNVTIKNSTLKGKYCFWVQYWLADGRDEATLAKTLKLDIFNTKGEDSNNNTFTFANDKDAPVLYGFNEAVYFDEYGQEILQLIPIEGAEGVAYDPASAKEVDGEIVYTTIVITADEGMDWFTEKVDSGDSFEGKTIKLDTDIDLYKVDENGNVICFEPIGSYRNDTPFKGTFDGQHNTIKNLNQNTWALNNGYYYGDLGMGLFGMVQDATIKNLKMDNASISGENGLCGIVAGAAYGDVTFENITVTNSKCNDYQYYAGGIVGWASGNHTYKNCNIDASNVVGGQWGDFGNSNGGIIGGISGSAQILMEDCNVACIIDAVNDVVSAYQYYAYRCCGMLIGNTNQSQVIDGTPYAAAPQLTCKNVTVTYGDWMNYTYCEFAGTGYPYVRVQAGVSVDAYTNIRYGHPTDANGNTVVDDNHVHNDGEDHHLCIPFDQLLGGGPNGNGRNPVYGLASFPGVTVNYPASYTQE